MSASTGAECCCVAVLCTQVRCKTGSVYNNGRPLLISDLIYGRPYQVKDNFGRDWPGGCAGCSSKGFDEASWLTTVSAASTAPQ